MFQRKTNKTTNFNDQKKEKEEKNTAVGVWAKDSGIRVLFSPVSVRVQPENK